MKENGWPTVFAMTTKKMKLGQELQINYGADIDVNLGINYRYLSNLKLEPLLSAQTHGSSSL